MNTSDLLALVFGNFSAVLLLVVIFQNRIGVSKAEIVRSENRLSNRIDDLKKDMNTRMDRMDTRMDRIERLIERALFPSDDNGQMPVEKKVGKKAGTSA